MPEPKLGYKASPDHLLEIPFNSEWIPVPEVWRKAVPSRFAVEAIRDVDGTKLFAIIKVKNDSSIRHVALALTDEELAMPVAWLQARYINPATSMLGR